MKLYFTFWLCIGIGYLQAQQTLHGIVVDNNNQPVNKAIVSLLNSNKLTTSFTSTDEKGKFSIKNNAEKQDSVYVKISCFNYETKFLFLKFAAEPYRIELNLYKTIMPEVKVKASAITTKGDTINYAVPSFANKTDRVIGDVISRLPGIQIDEAGKIFFNGKQIANYYIDGYDLLSDRYGMANNNIDFKYVDQVQIIEQDKNIKVLDSFKNTNNTSINIKLSKLAKNKVIGSVNIGSGYQPLLWEADVLAMKFNKNFQILNGIKSNNTGKNLSAENSVKFKIEDNGTISESIESSNLLDIVKVENAGLPAYRSLFNKNILPFVNILKEEKNKSQFKINFSFLDNIVTTEGSTITTFVLPAAINSLYEKKVNIEKTKQLTNTVTYLVNNKETYLKNDFNFEYIQHKKLGLIQTDALVKQDLNNSFTNFSNNLMIKKSLKKKLYTFSSDIYYNKSPQALEITPGNLNNALNITQPFDKVLQKSKLENFKTSHSLSFSSKIWKLINEIKLGNDVVIKKLDATLLKENLQTLSNVGDSFINKTNYMRWRYFVSDEITYKKKQLQITLNLSAEKNYLKLNNVKTNTIIQNRIFNFFNPSLSIELPINLNFSLNSSVGHHNSVVGLQNQFTELILTNYRSLIKQEANVQSQIQNYFDFTLSYKNPYKGWFSYIRGNYAVVEKDFISEQKFINFFTTSNYIYAPNSETHLSISNSISKFLSEQKTTIELNSVFTNTKFTQYIQNKLVNVRSNMKQFILKANYNGSKRFYIESSIMLQELSNAIAYLNLKNKFYKFTGRLIATKRLTEKMYCIAKLESNRNWNNGFVWNGFFTDISVQYKIKKITLDVSLINLTNLRSMQSVFQNSNIYQTNEVLLRPINGIINCKYNF